ncbi:MAG TPA: NAD(P)-dependent oxidoreductase [Ancylobacter sp.]
MVVSDQHAVSIDNLDNFASRIDIGRHERGQLAPPHALLINTTRGEVVDESALIEALKAGTIGGAGLDTFPPGPPAPDNPLWALDNVVLSPHIGGVTEEARHEAGRCLNEGAVCPKNDDDDHLRKRRPM